MGGFSARDTRNHLSLLCDMVSFYDSGRHTHDFIDAYVRALHDPYSKVLNKPDHLLHIYRLLRKRRNDAAKPSSNVMVRLIEQKQI